MFPTAGLTAASLVVSGLLPVAPIQHASSPYTIARGGGAGTAEPLWSRRVPWRTSRSSSLRAGESESCAGDVVAACGSVPTTVADRQSRWRCPASTTACLPARSTAQAAGYWKGMNHAFSTQRSAARAPSGCLQPLSAGSRCCLLLDFQSAYCVSVAGRSQTAWAATSRTPACRYTWPRASAGQLDGRPVSWAVG